MLLTGPRFAPEQTPGRSSVLTWADCERAPVPGRLLPPLEMPFPPVLAASLWFSSQAGATAQGHEQVVLVP